MHLFSFSATTCSVLTCSAGTSSSRMCSSRTYPAGTWNQYRWLETIERLQRLFSLDPIAFFVKIISIETESPHMKEGLISCDAISTVADKVAWNSSEHYVCFCLFYMMLSHCCSLVESTIYPLAGGRAALPGFSISKLQKIFYFSILFLCLHEREEQTSCTS